MIRGAGTTGGSAAARRLGKLIQTSVGAVLTSSTVAGVRLPSAVCQTLVDHAGPDPLDLERRGGKMLSSINVCRNSIRSL